MAVDQAPEGWHGLPMTLRQARDRAGAWLEQQGVEDGRSHAERLLLHILGIERAALLMAWHDAFPVSLLEVWQSLVRRRATGEPLQYVIGEEWFYGRPFAVTPVVLIPRPETELLVEAVLAAADRLWPPAAEAGAAAPTVVDVGTGSGAIAVTLSAERHGWRVCASDLSPDALEVARANAARHEATGRIAFAQGDLLAPFIASGRGGTAVDGGKRIDVLVSNPPYIPAADMPGLQREVRDYEPHLALEGGADGLDPYRRMLEQLPLLQAMPRIVAFELGMGQPAIVAELMRAMDVWDDIRIITDYNGIDRHIVAVRTAV
ncbi:peptide chain release factor N(5)-glutamine methyltransferase [Paenibacillus sp. 1011MAR3C5]|uniref:peptide chain release factor N(5)-glutamine methyltransferase n=1 Tax=Paenibacillus sp. 1011MAR3C5 TaxID=1675787 RepID=UPI000E6D173C|nr:peptide chain release factor N(5)-glutamine methyltransferase [Paenibacillus sp. 1011MAR3C5]RJE85557.1 peptide chain release factor N(5)-glutamine methyltransferase [Paenibacillus sp. 1011MAR3C5]